MAGEWSVTFHSVPFPLGKAVREKKSEIHRSKREGGALRKLMAGLGIRRPGKNIKRETEGRSLYCSDSAEPSAMGPKKEKQTLTDGITRCSSERFSKEKKKKKVSSVQKIGSKMGRARPESNKRKEKKGVRKRKGSRLYILLFEALRGGFL